MHSTLSVQSAPSGSTALPAVVRSSVLMRGVLRKCQEEEVRAIAGLKEGAYRRDRKRDHQRRVLKHKIQDSVANAAASESCLRAVDDAIKDLAQVLTRLQHERYSQFAALQVCERRLELRGASPSEAGRNQAQEALQAEKKVLHSARQELLSMEGDVKDTSAGLDTIRSELSKDTARKRLTVEAARSGLISVASAPVLSTSMGATRSLSDEDAVLDSATIRSQAWSLMDHAHNLSMQSGVVIARLKADSKRATARVGESLSKYSRELEETINHFRQHAKEVDYTIVVAERSLASTKKKLDLHDPQSMSTFEAAENMLEELRLSRKELQHDMRQKSLSLSIGEACKKVTPKTASVRLRPQSTGATLRFSVDRPTTSPTTSRTEGESLLSTEVPVESLPSPASNKSPVSVSDKAK